MKNLGKLKMVVIFFPILEIGTSYFDLLDSRNLKNFSQNEL